MIGGVKLEGKEWDRQSGSSWKKRIGGINYRILLRPWLMGEGKIIKTEQRVWVVWN